MYLEMVEMIYFHDENFVRLGKVEDLTDFLYFFAQINFLCLSFLYFNTTPEFQCKPALRSQLWSSKALLGRPSERGLLAGRMLD